MNPSSTINCVYKSQRKDLSKADQNTVEPVFSGHPRGMAKWPLNTGWPPNTGCKKYSSKNYLSFFYAMFMTSQPDVHWLF